MDLDGFRRPGYTQKDFNCGVDAPGQNRMHTWNRRWDSRRRSSLRPRLFTSRFYLSAFAAVRAAVGGNSSGASADVNPHEGRTKAEVTDRTGRNVKNKAHPSPSGRGCCWWASARVRAEG